LLSRLSHWRGGKIERHRSRQRRRVAALLELRHFGEVRRQRSAADASDPRRAERPRTEHFLERQHGRNCGTGRAEFPRGESSAVQDTAMKALFLIRYAKSSWDDTALPDKDRPLSGRGRRDAPQMGKRLAKRDVKPDLILSSPARRALTT